MAFEDRPELKVVPGGRQHTASRRSERQEAGSDRRPFRCHAAWVAQEGRCRSDVDCADDELCFDGHCV